MAGQYQHRTVKLNPERMQQRTREIIEQAIEDLMVDVGLRSDQALALLLIQAAVRMRDAATIRTTLGAMLIDCEG
jgi:hypothetical protein